MRSFLILSAIVFTTIDGSRLPLVSHPYHPEQIEYGTRLFHPHRFNFATKLPQEKPRPSIKLLPVQVVNGHALPSTSPASIMTKTKTKASTLTRVKPIKVQDDVFESMVRELKSSGHIPRNAEVVKMDASDGNLNNLKNWRGGKILSLDKVQSIITSLSKPFMEIDFNPLSNIRHMFKDQNQQQQQTTIPVTTRQNTEIVTESSTAKDLSNVDGSVTPKSPITRIIVVEVPHNLNLIENSSNFEWVTEPPVNLESLSSIFSILGQTVKQPQSPEETETTTTEATAEDESVFTEDIESDEARSAIVNRQVLRSGDVYVEDEITPSEGYNSISTAELEETSVNPQTVTSSPTTTTTTEKPNVMIVTSRTMTSSVIKSSSSVVSTTVKPAGLMDLVLNKAVTVPSTILSAIPGISFFPNATRTNSNFVSSRNHSTYFPNCHCDKLWKCQKLQISLVPRCQPGYFYCCYSERRSLQESPLLSLPLPGKDGNVAPVIPTGQTPRLGDQEVEVDDPSESAYEYDYDYPNLNNASNETGVRIRRDVPDSRDKKAIDDQQSLKNMDAIAAFLKTKGVKRQRNGVDPSTILRDEEEVKATGTNSQLLQLLSVTNQEEDSKTEKDETPKIADFAIFLMRRKQIKVVVPIGKKIEDYTDYINEEYTDYEDEEDAA